MFRATRIPALRRDNVSRTADTFLRDHPEVEQGLALTERRRGHPKALGAVDVGLNQPQTSGAQGPEIREGGRRAVGGSEGIPVRGLREILWLTVPALKRRAAVEPRLRSLPAIGRGTTRGLRENSQQFGLPLPVSRNLIALLV